MSVKVVYRNSKYFFEEKRIFVSHVVPDYDIVLISLSSNLLGVCVILSQTLTVSNSEEKLNSPRNNKLISRRSFTADCANSDSSCSVSWSMALVTIDLGI
jgi:hypothetical protein